MYLLLSSRLDSPVIATARTARVSQNRVTTILRNVMQTTTTSAHNVCDWLRASSIARHRSVIKTETCICLLGQCQAVSCATGPPQSSSPPHTRATLDLGERARARAEFAPAVPGSLMCADIYRVRARVRTCVCFRVFGVQQRSQSRAVCVRVADCPVAPFRVDDARADATRRHTRAHGDVPAFSSRTNFVFCSPHMRALACRHMPGIYSAYTRI